jgi:hypothetical protein
VHDNVLKYAVSQPRCLFGNAQKHIIGEAYLNPFEIRDFRRAYFRKSGCVFWPTSATSAYLSTPPYETVFTPTRSCLYAHSSPFRASDHSSYSFVKQIYIAFLNTI